MNDQKAMSEFFRVLKPGGWAILNVPVNRTEQKPLKILLLFRRKTENIFLAKMIMSEFMVLIIKKDWKILVSK